MPGKLTICPTPIGNLGDMPPRALESLKAADVVFAEDTRVTGKLLAALGVAGKRLLRLDENLMGTGAHAVVDRVLDGEAVVYCSDAGMPGVSDPGLRLVREARRAGVDVETLPGPTAVATAYVTSGCIDDTFYFGGFFPRKDAARRRLLQQLKELDAALVFYESPNRLVSALRSIAEVLPDRTMAVCRELTKLHEEVLRGSPGELCSTFGERASVKGEIVLVIDGPCEQERASESSDALEAARNRAAELAAAGERPKSISKALRDEFGISRNDAYAIALEA